MRTLPLNAFASTTLDGTGAGTASTGPTSQGEVWNIAAVAVRCATNTKEATCLVYSGSGASPAYFNDGTTWGSTGDSTSNVPGPLAVGSRVFAVWTGADAGTTAYLTVTGTKQVG